MKKIIMVMALLTTIQIKPMEFVKKTTAIIVPGFVSLYIGTHYNPTNMAMHNALDARDKAKEAYYKAIVAHQKFQIDKELLDVEFEATKVEYDEMMKTLTRKK